MTSAAQMTPRGFKKQASDALEDVSLQRALGNVRDGFIAKRSKAVAKLPEFDDLRDQAREIKDHVIENLDVYLERFEQNVVMQGGTVHWAADTKAAQEAVLTICRLVGARTVTKGKSMIGEEIHVNPFLEENGIEPVETDLGEYIIQLREEPPSHIIAPAIHVNKEQVADAFLEHHTDLPRDRNLTDKAALLAEARAKLRDRFLEADVGITGANFLIAETGSTVIVTNEGNGDLTQTLPRIHIVLASIEKVVPTLEDASTLFRVLARSATGQEMSVYTTVSTGPRRPGDLDGPEQFHVVLVDNGRSKLIGSDWQDILRCIRCGACLNHCPVYSAVGGHAYGSTYPGPMGKVLTPVIMGIKEAAQLPNASSFCGRCEEVCPMHIPLPKMMRHWREEEFNRGLSPRLGRWALGFWSRAAGMPWLYRLGARMSIAWMSRKARKLGRPFGAGQLPLAGGWTGHRDFPAPQGITFQSAWRKAKREPSRRPLGPGR